MLILLVISIFCKTLIQKKTSFPKNIPYANNPQLQAKLAVKQPPLQHFTKQKFYSSFDRFVQKVLCFIYSLFGSNVNEFRQNREPINTLCAGCQDRVGSLIPTGLLGIWSELSFLLGGASSHSTPFTLTLPSLGRLIPQAHTMPEGQCHRPGGKSQNEFLEKNYTD